MPERNMKRYNSANYGITFICPADWEVLESRELGGLQLIMPTDDMPGGHSDNMSILVRKQAQPLSEDPSVLSYIANEIIKANMESYKNYMLLSLNTKELNGISVKEMIYGYLDKKHDAYMQAVQTVFLKNNNVYLITYTASERTYTRHLPDVNQILFSIEVL